MTEWIHAEDACGGWKWCQFRAFCYKLGETDEKTWSEAVEMCNQENSALVVPNYFNEYKFFKRNLVIAFLVFMVNINHFFYSHRAMLCWNQMKITHFGSVYESQPTNSSPKGDNRVTYKIQKAIIIKTQKHILTLPFNIIKKINICIMVEQHT